MRIDRSAVWFRRRGQHPRRPDEADPAAADKPGWPIGGSASAPMAPIPDDAALALEKRVDALDAAVARTSCCLAQMMRELDLDAESGLLTRAAFLRQLARLRGETAGEHSVLHLWLPDHAALTLQRGAAAASLLVAQAAGMLQAMLRDGDVIGRLALDELGAVMLHAPPEIALLRLDSLRKRAADRPLVHAGQTIGWQLRGATAALGAEPTVAMLLFELGAQTHASWLPTRLPLP